MAGQPKVPMSEYLKRYMSDPKEPAKKKRKKRKDGVRVKAVDNVVIRDADPKWAASADDAEEGPAFVDGAAAMASANDEAPLLYNPDEMVSMDSVNTREFKGKDTFQAVGGGGTRHDSDSDSDSAPPRRRAPSSSPPRRRTRRDSDSDDPGAGRSGRHDSDSDGPSPPRRTARRHDSDDEADASPPRRGRHDSDDDGDASPPRRRIDSDGDASPPRRRAAGRGSDSDGDASPPRRGAGERGDAGHRGGREGARGGGGKAAGGRVKHVAAAAEEEEFVGGLRSAAELKAENERKRKATAEAFAKMGSKSGLGQETVHRDSSGRRLDPKLERLRKRQEDEAERAKLEAKMKWGRGISQIEERERKLQEELHEMAKPFARGKDDDDMNRALKEELRADDPMRQYIESQREKKQRAKGIKVKPKYKGEWPPNRYGIPPGHRWDGRDRSNGFEGKLQLRQNAKKARDVDAYKWSSEAM